MTLIDRSALLPYDAQQLFTLVNDVESYPGFMDGCVGAQVLRQGENLLEARLDLAKGGIAQSFSTRNRLAPPREIILELIDGPFDYFEGRWEFITLGEKACKLCLNLEFEMNSSLLGMAAEKLFDRVSSNLVDAIGKRAVQIYG